MKNILTALLIGLSFNVLGQQTVKIFNIKLNSKDVRGENNFFHPNYPSTSKLIDPGLLSDNIFYWIGKVYTQDNLRQHKTFLDLSNEETHHPLLDSIDMDFYSNYALKNILDKQFGKKPEYVTFRKAFKEAKDNYSKKEILIAYEYSEFFSALINSKIKIDSTEFSNSKEIENQIKFGIKASLDTLFISTYINTSAKLKAELNSMVEKDIKVTGKYYELGYSKEYLPKVVYYLKKIYEPNIEEIKKLPEMNQFNETLKDFYDSKDAGMIAGATLLSITIDYNTNKISKTGIEALIKANMEISGIEAAKMSTDIYAKFSMDKNITGQARTQKIFCVSYAYDGEVETFGNH